MLVERHKHAQVSAHGLLQEKSLTDSLQKIEQLREQLQDSQQSYTVAQTQLKDIRVHLDEEKKNLQEARQSLSDSFAALSKDALQSNNEMFLKLAQTSLEKVVNEAKGNIDQKEESIASMVKPLQETLKRYENQTRQMEDGRQKAFGSLEEQLRSLISANKELKMETGNLVSALKNLRCVVDGVK